MRLVGLHTLPSAVPFPCAYVSPHSSERFPSLMVLQIKNVPAHRHDSVVMLLEDMPFQVKWLKLSMRATGANVRYVWGILPSARGLFVCSMSSMFPPWLGSLAVLVGLLCGPHGISFDICLPQRMLTSPPFSSLEHARLQFVRVEAVDLATLQASFLGDAANVRKLEQLFYFLCLSTSLDTEGLSEAALRHVCAACEAMVRSTEFSLANPAFALLSSPLFTYLMNHSLNYP